MKASAEVTITITVPVDSSWGGDCSIAQVRSQAESQAKSRVEKMVRNEFGTTTGRIEINTINIAVGR